MATDDTIYALSLKGYITTNYPAAIDARLLAKDGSALTGPPTVTAALLDEDHNQLEVATVANVDAENWQINLNSGQTATLEPGNHVLEVRIGAPYDAPLFFPVSVIKGTSP